MNHQNNTRSPLFVVDPFFIVDPVLNWLAMRSPSGRSMVRAARIELALQAWEAHVLPIYYARLRKKRIEVEGIWLGKPEVGLLEGTGVAIAAEQSLDIPIRVGKLKPGGAKGE